MNLTDLAPMHTKDAFGEAMKKAKEKRRPIAEGFLYEQTILMIAADPGLGKSTVSTQVAIELAAGLPVFGMFKPPRPMKVVYIQTERSILEFFERVEIISKVLPINMDNLFVTDECQKLNLLKEDHAKVFIQYILRDCPNPDIIFIDPIYAMVSGGLKEDLQASIFTKVMSTLQKETGATLWYNHHTVKAQYSNRGELIDKDDPFYGSQWLKAHVTGSYYMSKSTDGVKMTRKKDNYDIHPQQIVLEYDPESELCHIALDEMPAVERLKAYIEARKIDKKPFTFKEIEVGTKLCTRTLRALLCTVTFRDAIYSVNIGKHKHLYQIK